jgi:hypothetical protein
VRSLRRSLLRTHILKEKIMSEEENKVPAQLADVSGADKVEILPGLFFEDKIKIKTQRRLEKQFETPVLKIFPGSFKNPITQKEEIWDGIDFTYLNNLVPLLTIFGQQADATLTEEKVEDLLDNVDSPKEITDNLMKFFDKIKKRYEKNQPPPSQ